ncbi:hypothetical protein LDL59_00905 [Kaistella anthropi]|nr:hypothetical protein [Kaistella anthropi]
MIVHGFNKRKTIGDEMLKNEFCLSFGKSALYNVNLQDFLKEIPIDQLFLKQTLQILKLKIYTTKLQN